MEVIATSKYTLNCDSRGARKLMRENLKFIFNFKLGFLSWVVFATSVTAWHSHTPTSIAENSAQVLSRSLSRSPW